MHQQAQAQDARATILSCVSFMLGSPRNPWCICIGGENYQNII